jgi:2-deoxy-D-gluconate 3-dehydrogenase
MDYFEELFGLVGKNIIVTGAGGLLGKAFSQALSGAGAKLYLLDVDEIRLRETCDSITCNGGAAEKISCDITSKEDVDSTVEKIADSGRIDALVNSAAIDPKLDKGKFEDLAEGSWFSVYPLEKWNSSLNVNLTGTFLVTQAVCRIMEKQDSGRGSIVNISSTYGLVGPDQAIYESKGGRTYYKPVDYSVTKAGVLGFTRAVAAFYSGTNIRVNALSPGGVENLQEDEFIRRYSSKTILGRMAHVDDFRGAIIFLCSDASSYMTGANLVIDGGWTAI